jgi:hypothetical protein
MTYNQYRRACQLSTVEPMKVDFKGIELKDAQIDERILRTINKQQPKAKTMAASAGR